MADLRRILFILLCFAFIVTGKSLAQDTLSKKEIRLQEANFFLSDRPWTLEVPLWLPGFAGELSHGDIEIEGEDGLDPEHPIEPPGGIIGEILSRLFTSEWYLRFFYLTKFAYEGDQFIVQLDAITGAVGESLKFKYNDYELVKGRFRTTNLRLFGGYKLINTFSKNHKVQYELIGYAGIRSHFQKVSSDLGGGGCQSRTKSGTCGTIFTWITVENFSRRITPLMPHFQALLPELFCTFDLLL